MTFERSDSTNTASCGQETAITFDHCDSTDTAARGKDILALSREPWIELQLETDVLPFIKETLFALYQETFKGFPNFWLMDTKPLDATIEAHTAHYSTQEMSVGTFPLDQLQHVTRQPVYWVARSRIDSFWLGPSYFSVSFVTRNVGGYLPTLVQIIDFDPYMDDVLLSKLGSRWLNLWRGRIRVTRDKGESLASLVMSAFMASRHIEQLDMRRRILRDQLSAERVFNDILATLEVKPSIAPADMRQIIERNTIIADSNALVIAPPPLMTVSMPLQESTRQKLEALEGQIREMKHPKGWIMLCNLVGIDTKTVKKHRPDLYTLWQETRATLQERR